MHLMKKNNLHPRNLHQGRYDLPELSSGLPDLANYVHKNKHGIVTVDFSNPEAVFYLNKALLAHHYSLKFWEIPNGYLCPPVPLAEDNGSEIPKGPQVRGLDIGTGASAIYPMLGHRLFGWSFLATETDEVALKAALLNVESNQEALKGITVIQQTDKSKIFTGIIKEKDRFDFTICNPPFHTSANEAVQATKRKLRNLRIKKMDGSKTRNFGGRAHELWTEGGELKFIQSMILESRKFKNNCNWFTSLVSKKANLPILEKVLAQVSVEKKQVLQMGQGQKQSRILCWRW